MMQIQELVGSSCFFQKNRRSFAWGTVRLEWPDHSV